MLKRFKYARKLNVWVFYAFFVALLILTPILTIIWYVFEGPGETWQHLYETVLADYILNSLWLMIGTGVISLVTGVSTAWIVSTCNFPGRRIFEWALVLPLAVPTYITAFAYAGLFDYTGSLQSFLRNTSWIEANIIIDIMNLPGLIFILSFVLYPYVYVLARASFVKRSRNLLEAGRLLGSSSYRAFFKITLPVARPALVGGVSLVIMEVLNDYGAVKYFGIGTFTTGIFRAWFSLGDINAAVYISAILVIVVFLVLGIERYQRGSARFDDDTQSGGKPITRYELSKGQKIASFFICFFPLLFGFLLPLFQMIQWAYQAYSKIILDSFLGLIINSFALAATSSLICIFVSIVLLYASRLNPGIFVKGLSKLSTMGYSIPGAVIAVGVMIPLLFLDRGLSSWLERIFNIELRLILSGTLGVLVFAYMVRFLAVAYNAIDSGFKNTPENLTEASRSLGVSTFQTLIKVNLPLLKGSILSGALLVFVDVLKELPLTLILRPFNFSTLATRTFELAGDERIAESSGPALIIIATGILPVVLLSKLVSKN